MFPSPETNYFNLDDIIASQTALPCKVELPIYRLGFLDGSTPGNDILSQTKMELPCWLTLSLCNDMRHVVSVELPKYYRVAYREIVNADAGVVDLHKLGPHYYRLGLLLLRFNHPEHSDVAHALKISFLNRFKMIMDTSQNSSGANIVELTHHMDDDERRLFLHGYYDMANSLAWQNRGLEKIKMSAFVSNQRKRKHAEMEATTSNM